MIDKTGINWDKFLRGKTYLNIEPIATNWYERLNRLKAAFILQPDNKRLINIIFQMMDRMHILMTIYQQRKYPKTSNRSKIAPFQQKGGMNMN